jgi:AcrR family transcriptional regulator
MPRTNTRSRTNGNQTKERILDAAEMLFANRGFDAVSLRDITVKAEVTLALASYHFGTKERLFESVVERRATFLCDLRRKRLADLAETELGDVNKILDVFMKPLFEQVQSREKHWGDYVRLLSRLGEDDRWLELLARCFNAVAIEFDMALRHALPQVAPHDVTRAFTMTLQLMLVTVAQHRRLDSLTDGAVRADDLTAAYKFLLQYATAGILNLIPQ